jgi:hypothetical protein
VHIVRSLTLNVCQCVSMCVCVFLFYFILFYLWVLIVLDLCAYYMFSICITWGEENKVGATLLGF